jgi:histone-lysine N-methyltransferase SETD2
MKIQLRRDNLESLTLIQILMRELNEKNWIFSYQINIKNQIIHLFFVWKSSKILLQSNFEVLVMNCIYKMNRYKMSLLIICEQIELNINFYVEFCFMIKEKIENYIWTLKQLKIIFKELQLSDLVVFVIDMKKRLMIVRFLIFFVFNHLLCIWHINNNVLIKCKKNFVIKEKWDTFFANWKEIMYVFSKSEYQNIWNRFSNKYNFSHSDCIEYLIETYIAHYHRRFVKCYIDQILHFETTMTSRNKDEHAALKRHLEISIENLKIVTESIKLLLINQTHNQVLALNNVKLRYSAHLRKLIFKQISAFVISTVINLMLFQYQLLTKRLIAFSRCTNTFIKTMRLSCNHRMQKRMYAQKNVLIENIHFHWW